MLPEGFLKSDIQYEKPYTRTIDFQTKLESEQQTDANLIEELRRNATNYLEENKYPKMSYTAKSDINQNLEIGDTIHVLHPIADILTEVLEYEYDVILEKVRNITFGNFTRDIKTKFNNIKNTIEQLNQTLSNQVSVISKQTDLINSLNKNGKLYIDDNELLILDALPKEKAKNVWRLGLGGFGFSSNGYEGPFETAITMDGQINAKFITTGTMSVSRIEGLANKISEYEKKFTNISFEMGKITETVSNTEKVVDELSKDIQVYSADLDMYNIIIPTNEQGYPLENKDYVVNFYTYFKGKQVNSTVVTSNTNVGIVCNINENIKLSVNTGTRITNLNNEYIINFIYQEEKEVYTVSKKITLTTSLKGEKGEKGDTGAQGIPGATGADGTSYYFYVRYSANPNGNPMTIAPISNTEYMGVASTTSKTAPTSYSAYTWSKIKGETGEKGTAGQNGSNGETSYLHIKYSDDGTTFTVADEDFAEGERPSAYIGQYTDFTEADSTNFSDYNWYKFTQDIDPKLDNMQNQIDQNKTDINNNYQDLAGKIKNSATQESVVSVEERLEVIKTNTSLNIDAINDIKVNGVSKVKTSTGYTFNEEGLTVQKTNAKTKSKLNEAGLEIKDATGSSEESLLFAGYDNNIGETIVKSKNMNVEKYFTIGKYSRIEDYENGTGVFWLGG